MDEEHFARDVILHGWKSYAYQSDFTIIASDMEAVQDPSMFRGDAEEKVGARGGGFMLTTATTS